MMKREITIRLEPELWEKLDNERHRRRTKWQALGEELFTEWLEGRESKKSGHAPSGGRKTVEMETDWRILMLREILTSGNLAAEAAVEAHLISTTLLVRHGPEQIDPDSLHKIGASIKRLQTLVRRASSDPHRVDGRLQAQRTA